MRCLILKKGKSVSSVIHPGTKNILVYNQSFPNQRFKGNEVATAKTDNFLKEFEKFDSYFT